MMFRLLPTDVLFICILSTISCRAASQVHWFLLKSSSAHSHHWFCTNCFMRTEETLWLLGPSVQGTNGAQMPGGSPWLLYSLGSKYFVENFNTCFFTLSFFTLSPFFDLFLGLRCRGNSLSGSSLLTPRGECSPRARWGPGPGGSTAAVRQTAGQGRVLHWRDQRSEAEIRAESHIKTLW